MLGCGDDGAGPSDAGTHDGGSDAAATTDAGPIVCMPPMLAPMPETMFGPCCARASNAERLDAPELRLAALVLTSPASVDNVLVEALLREHLDAERLNWLLSLSITGSTVTLTTGSGTRHEDGTFSFVMGTAPGPGDPDRWNPLTATGTIEGETFSTMRIPGTLTVPIHSEDRTRLYAELPLRDATLAMATLSESRTCIGFRAPRAYGTGDGRLEGFMTVEDAKVVRLTTDTLMDSFCNVLRAQIGAADNCETPQSEWSVPPDSTCDETRCTIGGCTPDTCNAWHMTAEIAAHGVEITP